MNIAFRVDANQVIGMGHLIRCLSIAAQFSQNVCHQVFITADISAAEFIEDKGFSAICLNSRYDDLEAELERLIEVISQNQIEKLVIDSYFATEKYLRALSDVTKAIYIDDINGFVYPVSMLINYNIYSEDFDYLKMQSRYNTKLLLGTKYTPLRAEFIGLSTNPHRETVRNILVTTGGSDNMDLGGKIAYDLLGVFDDITVHLVVGKFKEAFSEDSKGLMIHRDVTKMAELMLSCDLAVTAGGSTMYELCACGIPSICYAFADNQLLGVQSFDKKKLITYAGDFRDSESDCLSSIITEVDSLRNNYAARKKRSILMRQLVDGKGAQRIAQAIYDP